MLYAITDIETTGGRAEQGSITEIAILLHDGQKVVDAYQTLINPEKRLPPFVVQLTGITDAMLKRAPVFEDVADEIYDLLKDAVFVAHNVNFDFNFIKQEFNAIGYAWTPQRLCTIRLARKAFPDMTRYGLDNLCRELNITNTSAHRAMGDTKATAELFDKVIEEIGLDGVHSMLGRGHAEAYLPHHLPEDTIDKLPKATGVYYMRDNKGTPIYIGKAKNIRKRIKEHFQNGEPEKKVSFSNEVHHIDYVETSSELVAFLLEDQEIRLHAPKYNAAQKKKRPKVGLFQFEDQQGYLRLMAAQLSGQKTPLRIFPTLPQANKWLVKFCSYHGFSLKAIGMFSEEELTSLEEHNERMVAAMKMAFNPQHAILTHRGRDGSEFVFVLVEDGLPKGYGFINEHIDTISSVDDLKDRLIPLNTSELSAGFIQHFMDAPQGHRVKPLTQSGV